MTDHLYSLEAYQYNLPSELIAQHPCTPRDHSRLMLVDRQTGNLSEIAFRELEDFLEAGDSLVLNNTRVIPARLIGQRCGGGEAEIFLLKRLSTDTWKALARPGRKLRPGTKVIFGADFSCAIVDSCMDGTKTIRFENQGLFEEALSRYGRLPLPHYIQRSEGIEAGDEQRYQTVYAKHAGAVAAPTAGLHFSDELLQNLQSKGVEQCHVTLHVGLGTFKPVKTEDIRKHAMHQEPFWIDPATAEQLNARKAGKRQVCVGTTCCRALESAADTDGTIRAGSFETDIFIYPGYQFRYVRSLLTNFHLPGSTLLMLVSAFAGYELMKEAYQKAIVDRFRFYSYGDAMLIL